MVVVSVIQEWISAEGLFMRPEYRPRRACFRAYCSKEGSLSLRRAASVCSGRPNSQGGASPELSRIIECTATFFAESQGASPWRIQTIFRARGCPHSPISSSDSPARSARCERSSVA